MCQGKPKPHASYHKTNRVDTLEHSCLLSEQSPGKIKNGYEAFAAAYEHNNI